MPKRKNNNDEDDEDDEDESPFNFMDFLSNPEKLLNNKGFMNMVSDMLKNFFPNMPIDLNKVSPKDIQDIMKNLKIKPNFEGMKGPFMAGFNVNIGPDGKPKIDSFGNIKQKPQTGEPEIKDTREPLVEVVEEPDTIVVIAEMPGVMKEDIELKASTHSLTISTETTHMGRKYYKEIDLPAAINPDLKTKARYANGILEVKLMKIEEKSTNIKIE